MEDLVSCFPATKHVVMVWAFLLFFITTLRAAAEETDTSIFPKCKEGVGAMDIEGMIKKNPCMFQCPPVVKMVCSNDGSSHMNDCFLCKSACQNRNRPIFKMCDGRCPCKGKPHDEDMEKASEDCVDGACKTDAKDHYAEDYGYDVESPEAKYTSPVYEANTTDDVLHESKGYEVDPDGEEEDEDEDEYEDEEDEDGGEGEDDDEDDDLEDLQDIDLGDMEDM